MHITSRTQHLLNQRLHNTTWLFTIIHTCNIYTRQLFCNRVSPGGPPRHYYRYTSAARPTINITHTQYNVAHTSQTRINTRPTWELFRFSSWVVSADPEVLLCFLATARFLNWTDPIGDEILHRTNRTLETHTTREKVNCSQQTDYAQLLASLCCTALVRGEKHSISHPRRHVAAK